MSMNRTGNEAIFNEYATWCAFAEGALWERPLREISDSPACHASHPCGHRVSCLGSHKSLQQERPNMPQSQGTRFTASPLAFIVRHQLWDGNVQDHVDQG